MDSHLDKIWYYDSMKVPQDILDKIRDHTSLSSIISRKVSWDKKKQIPLKETFGPPALSILKKLRHFM